MVYNCRPYFYNRGVDSGSGTQFHPQSLPSRKLTQEERVASAGGQTTLSIQLVKPNLSFSDRFHLKRVDGTPNRRIKSPFYKNGYLWTGPKELILTDLKAMVTHLMEISFSWLPNSARFTVTHTSEVNFLWYRNLKGMQNFSKKLLGLNEQHFRRTTFKQKRVILVIFQFKDFMQRN